jgi:GNAT superfamily N-acetyltransferase
MVDIHAAVREAQGVRKVRADELSRTAAVLRSAFVDDPVFAWLLPDERRGDIQERGFRLFLERIWFAQGECYTTDNTVGAVVWELPGQWKLGTAQQLRLLPALVLAFRRFTPRLLSGLTAMEAGHPEAEHYYLPFIGVTPEWQGRGIGAALMAPILDRCDRDQIPAYLEASTPRNLALYERQGFKVTEEFHVGKGSPPLWRMWRNPAG